MEEATCSFSEANLLGKGGFGLVHKGTLRSGEVFVGKTMDWPSRNQGSNWKSVHSARSGELLISILIPLISAVGIPIVYRDFKSTIVLNGNFEAKISDLGLAKLIPEGQEIDVAARLVGTFGYSDPEYTSVCIFVS
ncbi:hypothetical protein GQ457_03G007820 [Hibiscus cannabinus]